MCMAMVWFILADNYDLCNDNYRTYSDYMEILEVISELFIVSAYINVQFVLNQS